MKFIYVLLLLSSTAFGGGVTGGGGNTRPANPVSPAQVKTFLRGARQYVLFYLHHLDSEYAPDSTPDPLLDKLLRGPVSAIDLVRSVDVSLAESGPCFYSDQNPVDGSAFAGPSPHVCVSVPRLAAVLSEDSLPAQAAALLLHEYSHLVGFTEAEAVAIQQKMLSDLGSNGIGKLDESLRLFSDQLERAKNALEFVVWDRFPGSWNERTNSVRDAQNALITMMNQDSLQTMQILSAHDAALLFMSNLRLFVLQFGACAMAGGTSNGQDCSKTVASLFANKTELTGSELAAGFGDGPGGNDPPFIADLRYGKIVDLASFKAEVGRAQREVRTFADDLQLDQRPLFP